jgi:hypothetical protein
MPQELFIYIVILIGFAIVLTPFGFGQVVVTYFFRTIFYLITSPYQLWKWRRKRREAKVRRQNYEILGNYVASLGNDPEILQYFRHLIEDGIETQELETLLEVNAQNLKNLEAMHQKEIVEETREQGEELKKMAAEQKELLLQSRLSLEQIKFREKLLEQLYAKIQKKYRL